MRYVSTISSKDRACELDIGCGASDHKHKRAGCRFFCATAKSGIDHANVAAQCSQFAHHIGADRAVNDQNRSRRDQRQRAALDQDLTQLRFGVEIDADDLGLVQRLGQIIGDHAASGTDFIVLFRAARISGQRMTGSQRGKRHRFAHGAKPDPCDSHLQSSRSMICSLDRDCRYRLCDIVAQQANSTGQAGIGVDWNATSRHTPSVLAQPSSTRLSSRFSTPSTRTTVSIRPASSAASPASAITLSSLQSIDT